MGVFDKMGTYSKERVPNWGWGGPKFACTVRHIRRLVLTTLRGHPHRSNGFHRITTLEYHFLLHGDLFNDHVIIKFTGLC